MADDHGQPVRPHRPSEGTLRRLIHLVDPMAHTGPGDYVPWSLLRALAAVVECEGITFLVMDPSRQHASIQTLAEGYPSVDGAPHAGGCPLGPPAANEEDDELFWKGFWECLPCSFPQRSGDHHTVTRLSDFYTQREFRRTTMGAYAARAGWSREIMLPLPPDGENDRRLLLLRKAGPDFTDRDALLLTLLRPHIYSLHLRQRHRNRGLPPLTSRQMEILRMVAAGLSNSQIARALYLSEATVGKHLENIYTRLDVTNRAAAATALTLLDDAAP